MRAWESALVKMASSSSWPTMPLLPPLDEPNASGVPSLPTARVLAVVPARTPL
jgi:hypothetical protein